MIAGTDLRLLENPGLGREGLERVRQGAVAVIGLGVLGGQVSLHLALLGIPQVLIDCDVVEAHNLANQMFPAASVGQPKAAARARQIEALNPDAPVFPITARVEDVGLGIFAGMALLVTGLDGRAARLRVTEVALRHGLMWVDAAVDGTGRSLRGTVTVFDGRREESACYGCRLAPSDLKAISKEGRGPGCPNWWGLAQPVLPPTLQASAFGGVIGGLEATTAVRVLLGQADDLVGRQTVVEFGTVPRVRVLELVSNPRCLIGHRRLTPLRVVPGVHVADLLQMAERDLGSVHSLQLHGRPVVQGLTCKRCRTENHLTRVARAFSERDVWCSCGGELLPGVLTETLSASDARRIGARTWDELGVPVSDVVTAVGEGGRGMHYVVNTPAAAASEWPRNRPAQCADVAVVSRAETKHGRGSCL